MALSAEILPTALEFKGRMMTLTVVRVLQSRLDAVEAQLRQQLQKAPGFFQGMPLLLDLAETPDDLGALVELFRRHELAPVALLQPGPELAARARALGLGVIQDPRGREPPRAAPAEAAPVRSREPTRIVTRPVRSGQQIYARGGDLIVMAQVGAGAEVIADGCVHIYGPLRGRALAGVQGDTTARIFCQQLEAELVAVAGHYRISEDIDEALRGRAVQVRLDGESLKIETL